MFCFLLLSISVRLVLRSHGLEGVILLLSDSKQMEFVALSLKEGSVRLSADLGKGPASIASSLVINDGEWHDVSSYPPLVHQLVMEVQNTLTCDPNPLRSGWR